MHPTALKLEGRLRRLGLDVEVRELADSTRTAAEAAAAVGCELGQIVKSVVLLGADGTGLLCLCAGDRMVDLAAADTGFSLARGKHVRAATGFAIGGVPPLGHDVPLPTLVDRSLLRYRTLWCAAGTPHALFCVETAALLAAIPGHRMVETRSP